MTSATEELRRLLDERGMEWWEMNPLKTKWHSTVLNGDVALREWNGCAVLDTGYESVTPEQAVEATLGRGTCRIEEQGCEWRCTGCGEVVGSWDPSSELEVSGNFVEMWDHCPMCGRSVVK